MNMPILEDQAKRFQKDEHTIVLHINHCIDNSFRFSELLRDVFHEVVFIAIPYNNKDVGETVAYPCYHAEKTGEEYVIKRNRKTMGKIKGDFIEATYALIENAFEYEIMKYVKNGKQVIIMEDGGYHHNRIGEILARHKELNGAILGCVEQTTSGTRKAYHNGWYPVLSVARSYYKVRIEAYFIASTVLRELSHMLHTIDVFLDFHHIYLLGYGIIGRSIAKKMEGFCAVTHVLDTDPEMLKVAERDGCIIERERTSFEDDAVVLGCAGTPSFTKEMLEDFLNGKANRIFLASASSKQTEFSEVYETIKKNEEWHTKYCTGCRFTNGKEIVLVADGYPVNFFDKNKESLTYSMIDVVFAEMLLLSIYLKENRKGLENRTYLLNGDTSIDSFVYEYGLIKKWKETHYLDFPIDRFNVHPLERKLKYIKQ